MTYCKIYKTIILPVVLYGCEAWSLILRQDAEANIWAQQGWEWEVEKAL